MSSHLDILHREMTVEVTSAVVVTLAMAAILCF